MRREYTREERLERACRRAAMLIRGMWQEKGSSDSRLVESLIIPDELTVVGRSHGCTDGDVRREHVVPKKVIVDRCHAMLADDDSDATEERMATFIRGHVKIVYVSVAEARKLDGPGIRQSMSQDWTDGMDIFERLKRVSITWDWLVDQP